MGPDVIVAMVTRHVLSGIVRGTHVTQARRPGALEWPPITPRPCGGSSERSLARWEDRSRSPERSVDGPSGRSVVPCGLLPARLPAPRIPAPAPPDEQELPGSGTSAPSEGRAFRIFGTGPRREAGRLRISLQARRLPGERRGNPELVCSERGARRRGRRERRGGRGLRSGAHRPRDGPRPAHQRSRPAARSIQGTPRTGGSLLPQAWPQGRQTEGTAAGRRR
jgi:hypothetical protein